MPSPFVLCSHPCEESDAAYVLPTINRYRDYLHPSAEPRWFEGKVYWTIDRGLSPFGDVPALELRMKREIDLAISRHAITLDSGPDSDWKECT